MRDFIAATRLEPIKVKNRVEPVQVYAVRIPDSAVAGPEAAVSGAA